MRTAIIGLSQAPDLLEQLQEAPLEVLGVADFDPSHPCLRDAREKGIFVTHDYTELLERSDLDLIINLIQDRTVEAIIQQLKPDRTRVVHAAISSFLAAFCRETVTHRILLELMGDLARHLGGFLDPRTLTGRILQGAMRIMEAPAGGIWSRKEGPFLLLKGIGLPSSLQLYSPSLGNAGLFDLLMEERRVILSGEIPSDPLLQQEKIFRDSGFRSLLAFPLIREFDLRGAILLFHEEPNHFLKEHLRPLEVLGDLVCQILEAEGALKGPRDLLIRDEITGLYNEVYFLDRLKAEIRRANRNESPISVLYLHLRSDHGMEYADQIMIRPYLRAISSELMSSIRNVDVPARYKQNDFVVLLPDTSSEEALQIAERLLERLSLIRLEGIGEVSVQLNIGIATYPDHATQPKELLDNAELAAFLAGRDRESTVRFFPTGRFELNGLTPEGIIRKFPALTEVFQVLVAQGTREPQTYRHAQEVAYYASLIAKGLDLPPERILEIGMAGWLHDIGKLTLPGLNGDLQKKLLRLAQINRRIHPTIGAYILKNLVRSSSLLKGVLYHHARYDGHGEPHGLRGESIPLEARILAVADFYQHLQSDLERRKVSSQREVFRELRRKSGSELDPRLVECLIRRVTAG